MTPFFKPILAFLGALLVGSLVMVATGHAAQLSQLAPPALPRAACVGSGFDGGQVTGVCVSVTSSPCSGRGCQPVTFTTTYLARWELDGATVSLEACNLTRHHLPQANQVTYYGDHTSCPALVYNPTGTTVVVDGTPFYYVSTDPVTGDELVNSNSAGYVVSSSPTPDAPGKFY